MQIITRISDCLEKTIKVSGLVALVLMIAMIFVNIVSRYTFKITFGVAEEWTVWLMIWSVFAFIGVNIKEEAHLAVDLFPKMLKGKTRTIFEMFISTVMIVFGVFFLYACWSDVMMTKMIHVRSITSIPVPVWIVKLCLPLGMAFFVFHAIERMLHNIQQLKEEGGKC